MNNQKHCEQIVLTPGSSLYYALLFVQPAIKSNLVPLIAFVKTIYQITMNYNEPDIAKTKLQWWQQEIINLYQSKPSHPISHELLPVIKDNKIPQQLFSEYLDGATLKINTDHFCTQKDIALFSYREFGVMLTAMCYTSVDTPSKLSQALHHFAYSLTLVDFIIYARKYHEHGKRIFPLDALEADRDEILLFSDYVVLAKAQYDKALSELDKKDKKELRALITYNKIKLKLLDEIKHDKFRVFDYAYQLTPLRKFLIAWWEKWSVS